MASLILVHAKHSWFVDVEKSINQKWKIGIFFIVEHFLENDLLLALLSIPKYAGL